MNYILQEPPDCVCCKAKAGEAHEDGCNQLAAIKAQAYPEVLDNTGLPWHIGTIHKLQNDTKTLKNALEDNARQFDTIVRLKDALGKIGRMRCFPDHKINTTTLVFASQIAREALSPTKREEIVKSAAT